MPFHALGLDKDIALLMEGGFPEPPRRLDFYLLVRGRYFISLLPPKGLTNGSILLSAIWERATLGVPGSPVGLATLKFTNKIRSLSNLHISNKTFKAWNGKTRLKRSSTLQFDR